MAEEGEANEAPEYGTAAVAPSLAWTDLKLADVKAFMDIGKVATHTLPAACLRCGIYSWQWLRMAAITASCFHDADHFWMAMVC